LRTSMNKPQFVPSVRIDDPERTRLRVAPRQRAASPAKGVADPALNEAADLYFPRKAKGLGYRHFSTLAEALEHVRETLTPSQRGGAVIQVGERRLEATDVARLLVLTEAAS
jgi:hypothetical protein